MTTTTNIQATNNTADQNSNNMTEEGTMNHANNNINMVSRISNMLRMENISKVVATAAVGLALTIGVAMPGTAKADVPTVINVGSQLASNWNDDGSLVLVQGRRRFQPVKSGGQLGKNLRDIGGAWPHVFEELTGFCGLHICPDRL